MSNADIDNSEEQFLEQKVKLKPSLLPPIKGSLSPKGAENQGKNDV